MLEAFDAVMPDHKPEFQRAKTPAQLDVPIPIIDHGARFGRLIAQVLGKNRKRLDQVLAVGNVEAIAIEVGEHPFVRIESVAVGKFHSILNETKLGAERDRKSTRLNSSHLGI